MRLVLAVLLAILPGRLAAAVVYGNYLPGSTEYSYSSVSAPPDNAYAWGLRTNAFSYLVSTVTIRTAIGGKVQHELDLFGGDEHGYTGPSLFHFAPPLRVPFGHGDHRVDAIFAATGGVNLEPNSIYWLAIRITPGTDCDEFTCQALNLITPATTVLQGAVPFLGNLVHRPDGTNLSIYTNGAILVEGEISGSVPAPEPSANKLFGTGMLLLAIGGYIRGHHH